MLDRIKRPMADMSADVLAMFLKAGGTNAYRDVVNALWERQPVFSEFDIQLYLPSHVSPDPAECPQVDRIFAAFRKAKLDQRRRDALYLPSGGWKKVLDSAYAPLNEAFENDDVARFHYFLANFGSWDRRTGIEESRTFRNVASSRRKSVHFEQRVMGQLIHWWKTYESDGRDVSVLTIPRFGNQGGVIVDGNLIAPNSVFSDFYSRLMTKWVHTDRPVITELGGGYGRLAYFLQRDIPDLTYVEFDLPETLCCAAYYLMLAFPNKRFLLYGEDESVVECLADFDFILLPSFEIAKLPDRSVDLFINENSLGVTPPEACRHFVQQMCRTSHAIWHRNHEVRRNPFEDGTTSLINREYPVDLDQFERVMRFADVECLIGHSLASSKNDMYWYYYRRRDA